MARRSRARRFRPATRAILWYPLVAVLASAGFVAWAWWGCGRERDPVGCREGIGEAAMLFFASVLILGLVLLVAVWLLSWPMARRRGLGTAVGFDREPGSSEAATRPQAGEGFPPPPDTSPDTVASATFRRAGRHRRS